MSKAMVTVEFDEYLELVEFKKAIVKNNIINVKENKYGYSYRSIYTKDEAIIKLTNELNESNKIYSKLKEENKDLKYKITVIRQFSIWQFLKYRKL